MPLRPPPCCLAGALLSLACLASVAVAPIPHSTQYIPYQHIPTIQVRQHPPPTGGERGGGGVRSESCERACEAGVRPRISRAQVLCGPNCCFSVTLCQLRNFSLPNRPWPSSAVRCRCRSAPPTVPLPRYRRHGILLRKKHRLSNSCSRMLPPYQKQVFTLEFELQK